ncbi:hypothetical protein [Xanthomonas cucurbitae]|uniref:Uncharacterized protein n=1 Tax=Xanthomonas cucurbitae TaxID=56453 RepID=A0ABY7YDH4_9XANT|nr:hypothetical protein [Xanthomonas cucurbitae]WDM67983.1 hypothetical protein K6981_01175 [Xanthomonas cucurbitae]WDM71857.1 hypothetical protein K6978_01170 [Xanthomonas cucurbitae]WDM75206.1 hypothetical protein K6982_18020 [Xanthomonas cucurbitae]
MVRGLAGSVLGLLAVTGSAQATEQIPDRIRIDGRQAHLLAEPLSGPLDDPATWKRFVAKAGTTLGSCTANWRGYQAFWRLDARQLALDRVVLGACRTTPPELPLEVLFPGQHAPMPAVWVDGELIVAVPPAADASSAAASYLLLRLRRGQVIAQDILTEQMLRARRAAAASGPAIP